MMMEKEEEENSSLSPVLKTNEEDYLGDTNTSWSGRSCFPSSRQLQIGQEGRCFCWLKNEEHGQEKWKVNKEQGSI